MVGANWSKGCWSNAYLDPSLGTKDFFIDLYYYLHYTCNLYIWILGTASVANGIAMVEINGLECEVTYSIIAGGTINENLIGPKSFVGNVTAGLCPLTTSKIMYALLYNYIHGSSCTK